MRELPPPAVITSDEQLGRLVGDLQGRALVAVDTESNSLYAYNERICLIQLSTTDVDYIVDPLADVTLGPLGEVFQDASIQKILHAAEQDVAGLKPDFGFQFTNLFDTMRAARILGWPKVGLGSILWDRFRVRTDKRYQRYDWGKRPLKPEALAYAQLDTHYLVQVRNIQTQALEQMGREEEAAEVFEGLAQIAPATNPFGPHAFWRVKGCHDLSRQEQAVLWELYLWRDGVAKSRNRPPFMVMGDRRLTELAKIKPRILDQLKTRAGLKPHLVRRYGQALLDATARGLKGSPPRPASHPPRRDWETMKRYKALRAWRVKVARRRGVESDVILPNAVLWQLAEQSPTALDELAEIPEFGPWKRKTYGSAVLEVLQDLK
jgi:ribonuclease D